MPVCMRNIINILALYFIIPVVYAVDIEQVASTSPQTYPQTSISGDGRFVAFNSRDGHYVVGDTNYRFDIFVYDRYTGIIERVNVSSDGAQSGENSHHPSISADGRFVAFESFAKDLVAGEIGYKNDVFVHDRTTGVTERVSVSSGGKQGNDHSSRPSISADGRYVAFTSAATNLVAGDTNDVNDVFVHDLTTGVTERVSVSDNGEQASGGGASISSDGQFVAFISPATNLVSGDTNGYDDVFVHDRTTGMNERVSVSSAENQANNKSIDSSISANGRFVVFNTLASNLAVDANNERCGFIVRDRATGMSECLPGGRYHSISDDGRFVAFSSNSSNLVTGDTNSVEDVFIHDRSTGMNERMSVSDSGVQGHKSSLSPSISTDGRFVVFASETKKLHLSGNYASAGFGVYVAKNRVLKYENDLTATLRTTSGATPVGEYSRFRAKLTNTTDEMLTNCKVDIINPLVNWQREFSYYTRPLNVANPVLNGSIDIAPGETGQFILALLPRVAMRKEVRFDYSCDSTQAYIIPFLNTLHLTAKNEPLISEDFVVLANAFPKTQLVIDRNNGKFWTAYTVLVRNTGSQPTSVNLTTTSDLTLDPKKIPPPRLCEPVDPINGDWSCQTPRAQQLQIELAGGESKKIRIFVHAFEAIEQQPVKNRIVIEARDQAGDVVAKTSMGISTLN